MMTSAIVVAILGLFTTLATKLSSKINVRNRYIYLFFSVVAGAIYWVLTNFYPELWENMLASILGILGVANAIYLFFIDKDTTN